MPDDIIGYLLDTLEPEEQERIERRIETDPEFRAEVERVRQLIRPLADDDFVEPPAGISDRTLAFVRGATNSDPPGREWSETVSAMRAVDYLVAASIVVVAITLLFPALLSVRNEQQRVACRDRLRALGTALAMYADQEHGQFPFVAPDGAMNNAGVFAMMLGVRGLLNNPEQLLCPSATGDVARIPTPDEYLAAQQNPQKLEEYRLRMGGSFGYTLGYREGQRHQGVTVRSDMIPVLSDRPPRLGERGSFTNSPNHDDSGQNVLFANGNVRWLRSVKYGGDNVFLNRVGQVGAGLGREDAVIGASEATPYSAFEL